MDPKPVRQLDPASWCWLMIPMLFWMVHALHVQGGAPSLAYSDFKKLVYAGKIRQVSLADETIRGLVINEGLERVLPRQEADRFRCNAERGCPFRTTRVDDPELLSRLEVADVRIVGEPGSDWLPFVLVWVMPLAVLVWMFATLGRRFGLPWPRLVPPARIQAWIQACDPPRTRLHDLAGNEEAKSTAEDLVAGLRDPARCARLGGTLPKAVLITGAAGTGKTLLAHGIAGEAGVPHLSISGSRLLAMSEENRGKQVRQIFRRAQSSSPCVLLLDDLDTLGEPCGGIPDCRCCERQRVLNLLFSEIDAFDHGKRVLILVAVADPKALGPGLFKTGRIQCRMELEMPHVKARETILGAHAEKMPLGQDVNLVATAVRTAGLSGADLRALLDQAAMFAARRNKKQINLAEIEQALDRYSNDVQDAGSRIMTQFEKQTMAYQEAGRALISYSRYQALGRGWISIMTDAWDERARLNKNDRPLDKQALLDRIELLLAGPEAEALVLGTLSTAARQALENADALAYRLGSYSIMDSRSDMGEGSQNTPASGACLSDQSHGEERSKGVAEKKVYALLQESRARVRAVLNARRGTLDMIAKKLMEHESLPCTQLEELIRKNEGAGEEDAAVALPPKTG